jgi:DUF4097 and DUF4098 domain-containing protein YvlB
MEVQMNKKLFSLGLMILLLGAGAAFSGQEKPAERVVVPFSNPAKPGVVEIDSMRGSITVKAYQGKEVIVEARVREKAVSEKRAVAGTVREAREEIEREAREEKPGRDKAGLKLIQAATSGLTVEEADNVVSIDVESWKMAVDLVVQVPASCSLKLSNQMGGTISVAGVSGDFEVENMNGAIDLQGISGTVVADTMNGEIKVTFARINQDKPMSFSTMNGDIDITLPADVKASFKLKSDRGNIYSDFDMNVRETSQKQEEDKRKEGGKYRITFEKTIAGTISGGGVELTFNTFQGDIYIRKAK